MVGREGYDCCFDKNIAGASIRKKQEKISLSTIIV